LTQQTTTAKRDTTPEHYTRSSYALPSELHNQIPAMVVAVGARIGGRKASVGALLTMLIKHQDEAAAALAPIVERFNASQAGGSNAKVARKQLQEKLKALSPEQVAHLLRQVEIGGTTPEEAERIAQESLKP
jgi:hypothetical protein